MWWTESLHPEHNIYLIPVGIEVKGTLNIQVLERSLNHVIQRHESLRTRYFSTPSSPVQEILPERSVQIGIEAPEKLVTQEVIQEYLSELCRSKFDLSKEPLLRANVLRWDDNHHVLLLVLHHLAADAWSAGVLVQELLELYPAYSAGQTPSLERLPIRYSELLQQEAIARTTNELNREAFWHQVLKNSPEPLQLPYDQPNPKTSSGPGQTYHQKISSALSQQIQAQCKQLGVTPYMLLLTAYSVLLYQYTGQRDIIVGSTLAGREDPNSHRLIGLCLKTLLLRIKLDLSQSLQELLSQVRDIAIDALSYPDIPFEALQHLQSSPGSWFQTMFILQSTPSPSLTLPNLELRQLPVHGISAKCPLSLWIEDRPDGYYAEWEYNTDCFSDSIIQRIAGQYVEILQSLFSEPQSPLKHQLQYSLPTANETSPQAAPALIPIHQQFEQQVLRNPSAIALYANGENWTYQDLNQKANQIAHQLLSQGVQANSLVAISIGRSPFQIAALLGIIKAGAAYLPLDPSYPKARLELMMQDAQPVCLITDGISDLEGVIISDCSMLNLQEVDLSQYLESNPETPIDLSQNAYVIYTSGSTGCPKGTILTHQGVANFIEQAIQTYGFESSDRILQFASISFDAAVEEIFGALCSGASLILRSDQCIASSQEFSNYCTQHQISVLDLPTAFWHRWVQDCEQGLGHIPASLREVIIGGERVLPKVVECWQSLTQRKAISLFNTYGPTEATVVATTYEITAQTDIGQDVAIGRPLKNVDVYILNADGLPVPQGAAGELYLGGLGLAKGYLNRPDKTAAQFVQHPFDPAIRLYRTGDRVQQLPNGDLAYLGRIDKQVKIRGFRVEVGEIEAVLLNQSAIKHCAVIATQDTQGLNQIFAYLVPQSTAKDSRALRQTLMSELPDYMIPARFIWVGSIPLTPNGKIDQRALLKSEGSQLEAVEKSESTPLMEELQELWQSLLKQPVDIHDSFFALGGHSLMAMQLHAEIQQRYQVDIQLIDFLAQPTIINLAHAIESSTSENNTFPEIPAVDIRKPQPLSIPQQRIWILDQIHDMGAAYHITVAQRIQGNLDLKVLEQCLHTLIARHSVLRTTFDIHEGLPRQAVHPDMAIRLDVLEQASLKISLEQTLKDYAAKPFKLMTGPLLRVLVIRKTPDEMVLAFVVHHIIADAWSVGLMVQEFMALYPQIQAGEVINLPSLPIQYVDFAQWQQNFYHGESLDAEFEYWKQQLQDAPTHLDLPTDYPRPATPTFKGELLRQPLPSDLSQAIKDWSQQKNVTLYGTLISAFGLLLHRYSRQAEIMVGTPTANRQHPQTQNVLGLFLNTLVMRLAVDLEETFQSLVDRTAQTAAEAFSHQDIPFETLAEQLGREHQDSSWFQVMFILQNAHDRRFQLPGMEITPLSVDMGVSKFDITLSVEDTDSGLVGEWEFNTQLFSPETIHRMTVQFEHLLRCLIASPDVPLVQLSLLPPTEVTQLQKFTQTPAEPVTQWVHQRFEAIAAQQPEAIALEFQGQTWSYQKLNTSANQIAHYLLASNVQAQDHIGVCIQRSPEAIATFLAILKIGACYIPLDPSYPLERLAMMIEDAELKLLLSDDSSNSLGTLACPCLHIHNPLIQEQSSQNPVSPVLDNTPAYLIYTSGSTGRPKGVVLGHAGLANFVEQAIQTYGFQKSDRILQFASISFDAAVEEIYGGLCTGATLVLRTEEMLQNYQAFSASCNQHKLTVLDLPTAFWHQLTQHWSQHPTEIPTDLRLVIIGGERALPSIVSLWQMLKSPIRLINTYGPTEATVVATTYEILADHPFIPGEEIPIGRPLGNVSAYVLDERQQQVPIGVPGELYIGGVGLALEYWRQPELTQKAFIPSPFESHQKLYRTGDLVKQLSNGDLTYLGRIDKQIKIRGFRVELGEIEAVLLKQPDIKTCAVIATQDDQGINQVFAYLVPQSTERDNRTLCQELMRSLPAYMIPARLVWVDALPLTPNGKIDQRALLAKTDDQPEALATHEATPLMEELQELWQSLLKQPVGIEDSFFALGGHSLMAMQLHAAIKQQYQVDIQLIDFLAQPTIVNLAHTIESSTPNINIFPEILAVDSKQPQPLSISQQRIWILDQIHSMGAAYHITVAQRIQGPFNLEVLEPCLQTLVSRHSVLRTTFELHDGQACQVVHPEMAIDIDTLDGALIQTTLEVTLQNYAAQPFDLTTGPLLRVLVIRQAPDDIVLTFVVHHIIADAWSVGLLVKEFMTLYPQINAGEAVNLPTLPIQYVDFAQWQQNFYQGDRLEQEFEYWQKQLQDAPTHLDLTTDYPRPTSPTFSGQLFRHALPSSLGTAIKDWSRKHNVTLYSTLISAFGLLLNLYSSQPEIMVGTPTANRQHPQTQNVMGLFLNTLVLRLGLDLEETFQSLVSRTAQTAAEAFSHQEVPFEKLAEKLGRNRKENDSSWFQVMFILQNAHDHRFSLPSLDITQLSVDMGVAKFDLTLSVEDTEAGLIGEWEFNTQLFAPETIERMTEQFEHLLRCLIDSPDTPMEQLSLLPKTEIALLQSLSLNPAEPVTQWVHQRFEAIAAQQPDAIALEFQEQTWTYQHLNESANQIAHYLLASNVQAQDHLGICINRSPEAIATFLAILKIGACYVPLDPSYPQERLAMMIEDAELKLLLSDGLSDSLEALSCPSLDIKHPQIQEQNKHNPDIPPANAPAYLIYTSGSTGRPKGVVLGQAGLANFTEQAIQTYGFQKSDRILQFASISFDAAIEEIYGALCSGATLVQRTDEMLQNHQTFSAACAQLKLTVLDLPTAFWHQLTQYWSQYPEHIPPDLQLVIIGGERALASSVSLWQGLPSSIRLINTYGPTEATVVATAYEIESERTFAMGEDIPIGRPLGNVSTYVLDDRQQQVPVGVPGELYIGGVGLALEYWQQPDKTQQAFVHPSFDPELRLYQTGDRVKMMTDGNLIYLGRKDNQVKVRGYRIELGEVESVLQQYPGVKQAIAHVHYSSSNIPTLVGYVVTDNPTIKGPDIQRFVQQSLPKYMVPGIITRLETAPLTPNGKIDRKRLPAPQREPSTTTEVVAPRNDLDQELIKLWEEILGITGIGIEDNFFDLGGHSLAAMQLMTRGRHQFAVDIPLARMFAEPTIAQLSDLIFEAQLDQTDPDLLEALLQDIES